MNALFQQRLADLEANRIRILDFRDAVANSGTPPQEIAHALQNAFEVRDWHSLQALVLVCACRPSTAYTRVLCRILDEVSPQMTNEDVVDVLHMINDPASVASLVAAAKVELPCDDFAHHFNRKCVWALHRIASADAVAALLDIAKNNPFSETREDAKKALTRLDHETDANKSPNPAP